MGKTCAIVDDAGFIREIIKHVAREHNVQVLAEGVNAEEAMQILQGFSPDLFFLDLVLPDVNGRDLLKKIRASYQDVKIVICTSLNQEGLREELLNSGANYFLQKPFSKEDLIEIFDRI
jgi:CheY-like chemotaxis protein